MNEKQIEHLRKELTISYKSYIEEKNSSQFTLMDIAKYFNIPIDKTRIYDYIINEIDLNTPSIEIADIKNNIIYSAKYTGNAEILNYFGPTQFNNVVSNNSLRKIERLYYIGSEIPIISKMTLKHKDKELILEKEMTISNNKLKENRIRMTISYIQKIIYSGREERQRLLTKIFEKSWDKQDSIDTFEQVYTYGVDNFISYTSTQDKYMSIKNNNVIYAINELEYNEICHNVMAICFENIKVDISKYFPFNMREDDYPILKDSNTISAMIFKGSTNDDIQHLLQICKKSNEITIIYISYKYKKHGTKKNNKEFKMSVLTEGTITSDEIKQVINFLEDNLKNLFINIIINELNEFGNKIDIKNGLIPEVEDLLSPKILIDKSFDEIFDKVNENRADYFNLISNQFESIININEQQKSDLVLNLNRKKSSKK